MLEGLPYIPSPPPFHMPPQYDELAARLRELTLVESESVLFLMFYSLSFNLILVSRILYETANRLNTSAHAFPQPDLADTHGGYNAGTDME